MSESKSQPPSGSASDLNSVDFRLEPQRSSSRRLLAPGYTLFGVISRLLLLIAMLGILGSVYGAFQVTRLERKLKSEQVVISQLESELVKHQAVISQLEKKLKSEQVVISQLESELTEYKSELEVCKQECRSPQL